MPQKKLSSQLEEIISRIPSISENRNYWLVRTQSGTLYDAFKKHGFVAIEHEEITLGLFNELYNSVGKDIEELHKKLKLRLVPYQPKEKTKENKERAAAIAASQIIKFILEVKKGDIVVIPSEGSHKISFGEITFTSIPELAEKDLVRTECTYRKRKYVKWIKEIDRNNLDPLLYKGFQAHQAINNWNIHKEYVERTIGNFFVLENEANVILEVSTEDDINAKELFKMGLNLLEIVDDFLENYNIELSTDNVEVKINLNSPGKIQFKAPDKKVIWLIGVLGVIICGGGLKVKTSGFEFDLSTDGVVKKVIDYQNNTNDRARINELASQMDSLKVLPPDDALKVLKQFSPNKDLSK